MWQSLDGITTPEEGYVRDKAASGATFSGGGSRAFLATIGALSGFRKLELTENLDYIAGISGVTSSQLTACALFIC